MFYLYLEYLPILILELQVLTDEVKWLSKYLSVDSIPNFGMDEMLEVFMIEFRQRLLNNLASLQLQPNFSN